MVSELRKAVHQIAKLSTKQQHEIARVVLDELAPKDALMKKRSRLEALAENAVLEYRNGKTKRMIL